MNSKTRVLNAFNRIKSDRIPLDFSINATVLERLMKRLKVSTYEEVLAALNVDFRAISVPFKGEFRFPEVDGLFVDPVYGHYTKWVENGYGGYADFCNFPLKNASETKIREFHVPSADEFDYSTVLEQVNYFKNYACYCGNAGFADIINATGRVMGMEDTLCNLITGDAATFDYIDRRADMELGILERIIDRAEGGIDFVWIGEDLGTQNAPMISLELYRAALKPIHKKFVDLAKAYNLPVMAHTCGSSSWVYEDFIELGVDAVDTLQPEATNMNPQYLKDNFAGRLSFHGCISTAGALAYSGEKEVEQEVKNTIDILKDTYSYMLAPTHMIQDNTPVENILKMFECAVKWGKY